MSVADLGIVARTARGAGWVVAWRMVTRLLGLVSMLVLVRLLAPGDFGLVALATGLAYALDACLLIGVEDQIIRARAPDRALYDTAFTMGLIRGLVIGAIVALAGPFAGDFFGDARLTAILYALALGMAASGLANIGTVDFRRQLAFHMEFRLLVLPRLVSVAATIGAAFATQSHWALVIGILLHRAGVIVMGYVLHPYRPRLCLSAWRDLVGVSVWTWAIGMAVMLRDRSDTLVIGRVAGPTQLGIFAAGVELATVVTSELALAASRAVMPGLADLRRSDDPVQERQALLRILGLLLLITLPAGVGASLVAGPAVMLLLGAEWIDAVPVVAIIALAGAVAPLDTVGSGWLRARAALKTLLLLIALGAALRIGLLLALTDPFGLPGAAVAAAIGMVAEPVLIFAVAARWLGIPASSVWGVAQRPLTGVAAMAALLSATGLGWAPPPADAAAALRVLAVAIPSATAAYLGVLLLLWRVAGAPDGAEADALVALRRMAGAFRQALPLPRPRVMGPD